MKLLFTIPHFYQLAEGQHGSSTSQSAARIAALTEMILAIHQLFGKKQCEVDIFRKTAVPANTALASDIDIVICTTGASHLVADLPLPADMFRHQPAAIEPMMLGFECHGVFRAAADQARDLNRMLRSTLTSDGFALCALVNG